MGDLKSGIVLVGLAVGLAGCSDDRDADDSGSFTGNPMSGVDPGTDTGAVDTGADDGGGTGVKLDVGNADSESGPGGGECEALVDEASVEATPQDIIFVIDNSGSMEAEANFVQAQMNSFSVQIGAANIDSHIILISAYPEDEAGVCIDAPLGSGGCPLTDDNPPEFHHVNDGVGSNNALSKLLQHHPDYSQYLRPEAVTHIVVVTDDDSDMSAAEFTAAAAALAPPLTNFTFHGIISPEDPIVACLAMTTCCPGLPLSAAIGEVYQDLIQATGGIEGNLCEQQFQPVFQAVAEQIVEGAVLACSYDIPPPPDGEVFDPDKVNVEFDDGMGGTLEIGRVDDAAACAGVADGWYYDNPDDPTVINVCDQTCTKIQGFSMASIAISFGCETVVAG